MDNSSMLQGIKMPFHLLEEITNNFVEMIGAGGFSQVYLGEHIDGEKIAVKVLYDQGFTRDDKKFEEECLNLACLQHKNIVRLVGYCHETTREWIQGDGRMVFVDKRNMALCFEYMHKGSLNRFLSDEFTGLDWRTRYAIIKGICQGVKYLHEELENPLYHLDLKPSNILLDNNMLPKITDFGLSILSGDEPEEIIEDIAGTLGYMSPEHMMTGIVSLKCDIFALGVTIVEIITGQRHFNNSSEMSTHEFIENVLGNWRNRLHESNGDELHPNELDSYCKQVKTCIEVAVTCVKEDRHERPNIGVIVDALNKTETASQIADALRNDTGPSIDKRRSEPHHLSFRHFEDITNKFSGERLLGRGASGEVYKGELQNGKVVAVKKVEAMCISKELCEQSKKQFENEVNLLMGLEHQNIVQLLNYCYEMKHVRLLHGGKFTWKIDCLLCLEFLPEGSLDNRISDANSGLDWHTRYKIIEGISNGLQYLHEKYSDNPIIHSDLKPANILLDANMVPKIADFGISRLSDQGRTIHTKFVGGTPGYMPPEFTRGIITPMSDIFSLGVTIIEIITGHKNYPYVYNDASSKEFINMELGKWRNMLEEEPANANLETDCQQIEKCLQICLMCVNPERTERPTIRKIINMLQGLESTNW